MPCVHGSDTCTYLLSHIPSSLFQDKFVKLQFDVNVLVLENAGSGELYSIGVKEKVSLTTYTYMYMYIHTRTYSTRQKKVSVSNSSYSVLL